VKVTRQNWDKLDEWDLMLGMDRDTTDLSKILYIHTTSYNPIMCHGTLLFQNQTSTHPSLIWFMT